ncbi:hypothetical protein CEE37_02775 [candidate division LCP-89 bacterium B3_LCP]|uniref:Secretion system C-terminal sorting domain-containing protein n=1 Tax=candidate division LCP-89 bacterium B3_LCP TaxID=2012998 RepID=A0A532V2T6_UNCL8|nr:MAG: hypothetical protein CEE37_02775 [candidate division LCP-89 bacterium B3_LCP]
MPFHVDYPPFGPFIAVNSMGTTIFSNEDDTLLYNIVGWNDQPRMVTVDIWADVTLPDGSIRGPIFTPVYDFVMYSCYLDTSWSIIRNRDLCIPGFAPEGTYLLNVYIGEYDPINPTIEALNHLYFYKNESTGGGGDLWLGGVDLLSVEDNSLTTPVLYSNYPNPFNPTTVISFDLPVASLVKLEVFDVNGRNVNMSGSGTTPTTEFGVGTHQITFDGSGLASGIYIYRISAGEVSVTGKMVLMK